MSCRMQANEARAAGIRLAVDNTAPDWKRPPGCQCVTMYRRERCENNCDPVEDRRGWTLIGVLTCLASGAAVCALLWLLIVPARAEDYRRDAYLPPDSRCDGSARYEAMAQGRDCSGYYYICKRARDAVKRFGSVEAAEKAALKRGYSQDEIDLAKVRCK